MTDAVFTGTFSDFKSVKTRSVCQIIIEVPVEKAGECLAALGGWPIPGEEKSVAVARIVEKKQEQTAPDPAPAEGRQWQSLRPSQQAGILCADTEFQEWIVPHAKWGSGPTGPDSYGEGYVVDLVRDRCGIGSRAELDTNQQAAAIWNEIVADFRWHQKHGGIE